MQFWLANINSVPLITTALGGFILMFGILCHSLISGFVSFLIKERLFLSESLVSTIIGIAFGPIAGNLINPELLVSNIQQATLDFSQIVICIQIMNAAICLPRKFWLMRWKTVSILLFPVLFYQWMSTAVIVYFILQRPWFESLIIAACAAPTDPVIANSIVSGRFADLHIPIPIRQLLSAESAANDGVILLFFSLGTLLLNKSYEKAIETWLWKIVAYELGVAIILGIIIGYLARITLRYSELNNFIDKKSFVSFEIALTLFTSGISTLLHVSSFVAVFAAGMAFSWDDWFSNETEEAHVQEVIDMLLNLTFFIYFGSIIPWASFNTVDLPLWRLFVATICILIFRRLPIILLFFKLNLLPPLFGLEQALLVGWFGPIGVGALWYMAYAVVFYPQLVQIVPIVSFMVMACVICFGITVPFAHITLVTISSISRSRQMQVPTWPTNVPRDTNAISGPTMLHPMRQSSNDLPTPANHQNNNSEFNQDDYDSSAGIPLDSLSNSSKSSIKNNSHIEEQENLPVSSTTVLFLQDKNQ